MQKQMKPQNSKILVVGKSGSGKTTFAHKLVSDRKEFSCLIYDHEMEWSNAWGYFKLPTIGHWKTAMAKTPQDTMTFVPENGVSAIEDFAKFLPEFLDIWGKVYRATGKQILLVVDEIATVVPSYAYSSEIATCIERSRRSGINYLLIAHRLASVHPSIREQMTVIWQFRATDPATLRIAGDYLPDVSVIENAPDFQPVEIIL